MKITYGERWFRANKCLTTPLSEARARYAHEARKLYAVRVENSDAPSCFLEFNNGCCVVGFLDHLMREYLSYVFANASSDGQLFLEQAIYRVFVDDTDKVLLGTIYYFSEDGTVEISRKDYREQSSSTATSNFEVARNREDYPKFGKYQSLIRENR